MRAAEEAVTRTGEECLNGADSDDTGRPRPPRRVGSARSCLLQLLMLLGTSHQGGDEKVVDCIIENL